MNRKQRAKKFSKTYGFSLPTSVAGRKTPKAQSQTSTRLPSSPTQSPVINDESINARINISPPGGDRLGDQSLNTSINMSPGGGTTPSRTPSRSPIDVIDTLLHEIDQIQSPNNQSNNDNNDVYNELFNTNNSNTPSPARFDPHNIQATIMPLPTARPESEDTTLDIIRAINDNLTNEWKGFIQYYGTNKFRAYYYRLVGSNAITKVAQGVYCIPRETKSFESNNKNSYNIYLSTEALIYGTSNSNIIKKSDYIHVVKDFDNNYYCPCATHKTRKACKHALMAVISDDYAKMEQNKTYKEVKADYIIGDGVVRIDDKWQLIGMYIPRPHVWIVFVFYFYIFQLN